MLAEINAGSLRLLFAHCWSLSSAMVRDESALFSVKLLEARGGIEPPNKGFADLCLTTWLPRRPLRFSSHHSIGHVVWAARYARCRFR
jgi:hypothetical protein